MMASRRRSFAWSALGALTVLIAAGIIVPQYSDYRSLAEGSDILIFAEPLQAAVAAHAVANGTLKGSGADVSMPPTFFDITVQDDGVIILHNRHPAGHVFVLSPEFNAGVVTWRCIGGSRKDVPLRCR